MKRLFAFGSVLTNRFTDKSDIDLVVDFENVPVEDYADNYFSLKDALSAMLHREIDLLEDKAIRNPMFRPAFHFFGKSLGCQPNNYYLCRKPQRWKHTCRCFIFYR